MRYKDLFEASSSGLSYEDQIKPWAYKYAKEAGIHPRFALGLFDKESGASYNYQGVGDEGWAKEKYPNTWREQLSYGPGHFSIRALDALKILYHKDPQIKSATWETLRDNPEAAARFAVLHLANLAKEQDGDFHTAYKHYRGNPKVGASYTNKDGSVTTYSADDIADQFITSVQDHDNKIVAKTGEKSWDNPHGSFLRKAARYHSKTIQPWIQQNLMGMSQKEIADAKKERKKNQQKADRLVGKQYTVKDMEKEWNAVKGAYEYVTSPEMIDAMKKTGQDVVDTITNPLNIKPDDSYGKPIADQESGEDSTEYMKAINKSLDKGVDWAKGKLHNLTKPKKESMKTFKNYLDEVYNQRANSPTQSTGGAIQSQGSVGSKRPTVKGQNANQADMDAGKEQPDEFTTTITGPDGQVIDQSVDSASTAMRKKRAGTVANRGQAIRKIAGVS